MSVYIHVNAAIVIFSYSCIWLQVYHFNVYNVHTREDSNDCTLHCLRSLTIQVCKNACIVPPVLLIQDDYFCLCVEAFSHCQALYSQNWVVVKKFAVCNFIPRPIPNLHQCST